MVNVFAYDAQWPRDSRLDPCLDCGKPRVFPLGGTKGAPHHSTLSVEFFQRFDRVIEALDRHGLIPYVMIYVWNKDVAGRPLTPRRTTAISITSPNLTGPSQF